MRQRKIKDLDNKLARFSEFIIENPKTNRGKWKEIFDNSNPVFIEIGCGKGQFISKYAKLKPDWNFIAVEGNQSVVLRALEKAEENELKNVKFVLEYMNEAGEYFEDGELSGMFLNFSDPWPKGRHEKRRLTYGGRLMEYCRVIEDGGFIRFKTDNDRLFDFTLEQIESCGLSVLELTRDLHNSDFNQDNVTTEYEDKFSSMGKNINYVKIRA